MTAVVELEAVTKRYGDVTALDDVTVTFGENRITGLLGRNGAGKSTLMQVATARDLATSGAVRVFGQDPYENAPVLDRVCFIGESQAYPTTHKVRHVLESGDTALLVVDWEIPQAGMSGTATDVARRQPDGTWRCVIDNPHGGARTLDLRPEIAAALAGDAGS